ncbi:uncharacterized protein LOC131875320 [Cryptomeria japonica]|uniref:uncharacterized protein LOC131875320 n=1 Tax=Cryptomeria japonica TaxID=3369 RepID=UPI0027D9F7D6|nr:uncharacterized protein LOC131875320 [Cryptomeria japonica]
MLRRNTKWCPPRQWWFKENSNGVARWYLGEVDARGVIRMHVGEMVVAYSGNLKGSTNDQVEGMVLLWGLKVSLSIGFKALTTEGDSKLMIDAVKGLNKVNWSIEGIIKDIHKFLLGLEHFEIGHVYREGNEVVDALAALGSQIKGCRFWRRKDSLPNNAQLLLHGESQALDSNG